MVVKEIMWALAGVAQLVGASSHAPKISRFDFPSGHIARFWVRSPVRASVAWEATDHCFSLSLFLPLSLKVILYIIYIWHMYIYLSIYLSHTYIYNLLWWGLKKYKGNMVLMCFSFTQPWKTVPACRPCMSSTAASTAKLDGPFKFFLV